MRFKQVAIWSCIILGWTAPAYANWSEVDPLVGGTCSSHAANDEGIIASVVMDQDESADLVFGLRGQRGSMFVVNFSNGTDKAFEARDNSTVSLDLSEEVIAAFRESSAFQLYKGGTGFLGSPFSLRGSSQAFDSLLSCVKSVRRGKEVAAAGELGAVREPFSVAGIELGMNATEVQAVLAANGFAVKQPDVLNTFRTQDASGRRMTIHLEKGSAPGGAVRFFMNVPGADTDVSNIPTDLEARYGAPSAIHGSTGHKIWYRTEAGQVLRHAQASFLSCPGSASSRLVLRAQKAGTNYLSGSGRSVAATNNKYEIAVDNCRSD